MSTAAATHVVEVNGDAIERYTVAPDDVGLDAAPARRPSPAARPRTTPRVTRAILGGEPVAARATSRVLNAGAAIYAAGRADTLAEGVAARARGRIDAAPRPRRSTRSSRSRTELAPALNVLDRIVSRRRCEDVERAAQQRAARRARGARSRSDPRARPFTEALHAPGHLADRRAQAPLAVGRRDPRGRDA